MSLKYKLLPQGDSIYWLGSLENKKIILLIGRENFSRDKVLIETLIKDLSKMEHTLIYYENIHTTLMRRIDPGGKYSDLPSIKRNVIKGLSLLKNTSSDWNFFLPWHRSKILSFEHQRDTFRTLKKYFKEDQEIIIFARSAGGILGTSLADEFKAKKVVCLSYPFRHPQKGPEAYRFSHLETLSTPALIVQGIHDKYGGQEIIDDYRLSPKIKVSFVDTDHDFNLQKVEWEKTIAAIHRFIQD